MTALLAEIETKSQKLNISEQKKLQTFLFNNLKNSKLTDVDREWIEVSEKRFNDILLGKTETISKNQFIEKVRASL